MFNRLRDSMKNEKIKNNKSNEFIQSENKVQSNSNKFFTVESIKLAISKIKSIPFDSGFREHPRRRRS